MTAYLWMSMIGRICRQYGKATAFFGQMTEISGIDRLHAYRYLAALADGRSTSNQYRT